MNIQKDLEEKRKEKIEKMKQRQVKLRSTNAITGEGYRLEKASYQRDSIVGGKKTNGS